jgi:hypothetical protein
MKLTKLSALRIGRLYPPENIPDTHFCYRMSRPQGHNSYSKLQPTRCNVSWFIYFYRHSTCFRRFLHPSSGAHNCSYSFRHCQPVLLLAATVKELEQGHSAVGRIMSMKNSNDTIGNRTRDLPACNAWPCHFKYDVTYLLTAIGLPLGGSSRVHIYTQNNSQNNAQHKQCIEQHKKFWSVRAVPRLCGLYPGICITTEEKARKNLSQGSRRVPVGTMEIRKHIIWIHRHNNKNT